MTLRGGLQCFYRTLIAIKIVSIKIIVVTSRIRTIRNFNKNLLTIKTRCITSSLSFLFNNRAVDRIIIVMNDFLVDNG